MIKKKVFDCVEMKSQIQARLEKEYEGLSDDEAWARIREKAETSENSVWTWWRSVRSEKEKRARGST